MIRCTLRVKRRIFQNHQLVPYSLVFWTGVKLPTGLLDISLVGEGKAKLIALNRNTGIYDELIAPPATNYITTITDWRDTYCNPNTLYVQSSLVPMTNGLGSCS